MFLEGDPSVARSGIRSEVNILCLPVHANIYRVYTV